MALFVHSEWTGTASVAAWLGDGTNSAWLAEHYAGTTLSYGTNAFGSFTEAYNKATTSSATDHEICVLDGETASVGGGKNYSISDLSLSTGEGGTLAITVNRHSPGGDHNKMSLENISIGNGVVFNCQPEGVSASGTLAIEGSFSCTNLSGSATVSVSGANAHMNVHEYSGSGPVTVGNGATVTIDKYSGEGSITVDGTATLNIITYTTTPSLNISIDTTTSIPYTKLASINGFTKANYETAVGGTASYESKELYTDGSDLYYAPKNYYYVNSDYSSSAPSVLRSTNAKSTVAEAVTAGGTAGAIFVTGGSFGVDAGQAVAFNGLNAQILGVVTGSPDKIVNGDALFTSSVAGGECIVSASTFTFTQANGANTHLEINGGTFGKTTVGGDFVTQGNVFRTGDINLTINGGEFVSTVGGGMAYTPKNTNGSVSLNGNVKFLITGGTFNRRLYGGNICCNGFGGQTALTGDVNLTIDASKNVIAFKEHIVAGSFDQGSIEGNTNVTLKGLGSNLKTKTDGGLVAFSGTILGGSGATYIRTTGGTRVCTSFVSGRRNFAFEGFTGEFAGEIKAFTNISFDTATAVEFTNSKLNLQDISSWNLAFGSTVTATKGSNNFAGDSLALDLTGWDNNAWTVMSGTADFFTNWDAFGNNKVTLGEETATFANGKWASTSYQLTLETSGSTKMLVLATIS